jgi:outer membrane protein assembly factor BamB
MVKRFRKKVIIFSFIVLLFGMGILPNISGNIKQLNTNKIIKSNIINDADWWKMYGHDLANSAFSSSNAPDNNNVLWSYQNGHRVTSSAAFARGKVYIGDWYSTLYCFNISNGQIIWTYDTEGEITSSPTVFSDKVYFGSRDLKVYCLNADNGDYIWDYKTKGAVESSPAIAEDKIFIGSNDGKLYCLDFNTGDVVWIFTHGNVISTSPVFHNSRLFFGTIDGVFYCINSSNGQIIWNYSTSDGILSSATVSDGKVIFGSNDKNIYCLDVDDGGYIWSYETGDEVHSSPAVAYGNIYIGSLDGNLYCINIGTGDVLWTYWIDGEIQSSPTVADDKVYFGTNMCCGFPNYIICVNAHNGNQIWDYYIGSLEMRSSPAITAGKVIAGSHNGEILAFGTDELIASANGPYYGNIGNPIQFMGGAYGGSPDYSWCWDFGDNETSYDKNPIHTYENLGSYTVTLSVIDGEGNISIDTTYTYISEQNYPPGQPIITGEINGNFGESYNYTFLSTDSNHDEIYYYIDWDDNAYEEWIGPYNSGEEVIINHTWNSQGEYIIRCKAKDTFEEESDWGYLTVTMPLYQQSYSFPLLQRLLERFPNMFPILRKLLEI